MSIKEALERPPSNRGRVFLPTHDEYALMAREKGLGMINAARVPERLKELAAIVKPEFPDVKIKTVRLGLWYDLVLDGLALQWGFEKKGNNNDYDEHEYNEIFVAANHLTRELVVGGARQELLREVEWRQDEILEEAIVDAFRNPLRLSGPSVVV